MSRVENACIMNICIYGRAGTIYVYMYYVCVYLCTLFSAPIGAPGGIDVSLVEYACVTVMGSQQNTSVIVNIIY